jgi:MFS transporter, DHA3 family, macrolide efflux protein
MAARQKPTGFIGFTFVWTGQLVSVLASSASSFALTIWAYQTTGSANALGVVTTAFLVPFLVLSPIAGAMVDRYNRKLMMMMSDFTAATATVMILVLQATGGLHIWHLYLAAILSGLGNTFQWPAYSAAITTMVPKEQYQRANGMMSLVDSGPGVFAPILAGALYPIVGLTGILVIDIATFLFAIGTLLVVHIPTPPRSAEGVAAQSHLLREAVFGFKYIFARKSLLGLALFFVSLNFVNGMGLVAPFILARTGNDSASLGAVMSAAALGGVAAGLALSAWGGFKRRMTSILVGEFFIGFIGLFLFGMGRSLAFWIPTAALGSAAGFLSYAGSQAIWQAKVPPDLQGRVFSARRLIAWAAGPITPVLAGAIADYVTEPAMTSDTWLAHAFGWLVGTSPGAGLGLQYVLAGVVHTLIFLVVLLFVPVVRNLEDLVPDYVMRQEEATPPPT